MAYIGISNNIHDKKANASPIVKADKNIGVQSEHCLTKVGQPIEKAIKDFNQSYVQTYKDASLNGLTTEKLGAITKTYVDLKNAMPETKSKWTMIAGEDAYFGCYTRKYNAIDRSIFLKDDTKKEPSGYTLENPDNLKQYVKVDLPALPALNR